MAVAMTNIKMMRDPYDPDGEPMLVDLDDMITIKITTNWCSGCKANVAWEGGRWTYWLGEPDKWFCDIHEFPVEEHK
jgi:hypothetical protein